MTNEENGPQPTVQVSSPKEESLPKAILLGTIGIFGMVLWATLLFFACMIPAIRREIDDMFKSHP